MGWETFGDGTNGPTHRRPYVGRGLFVGGIGLLLGATALVVSVSIAGALGLGTAGARELAGALAGIGLAAALVGALSIVPTDRGAWNRALGGACLAVLGVGAFLWAYPGRWYGDGVDLTLSVLAVYVLGIAVVAAYLFASVVDPARRAGRMGTLVAAMPSVGDPAPTASTGADTERTDGRGADEDDGEALYEQSSDPEPSNGNGSGADRTAATEPAAPTIDRIEPSGGAFLWEDSGFRIEPIDRPGSNGDRAPASEREAERTPVAIASNGVNGSETSTADARSSGPAEPAGSADPIDSTDPIETREAAESATESVEPTGATGTGEPEGTRATEAESGSDSDASIERAAPSADGGVDTLRFGPSVDRYCGNCGHFQYVRTENGLSPYCGYHEEVMDNMEPCLGWTPNF